MGATTTVAILVGAFVLVLLVRSRDQRASPAGGSRVPPPAPGSEGSIEALIASGRKIEAIKAYRAEHGVGLKQAKEAVEALARQQVLG
jgi:ribosomal protein L7/L12